MRSLEKVVFLDRDGVINRDSADYIKNYSEFFFLPGSMEAIRLLALNGFTVFVITNQSVINRKMVSGVELEYIHKMMISTLESCGGRIKDIFFCPHKPEERCSCRKPEPGLIFEAQKTYKIDLGSSVMVGDSAKDIECARNAGCAHNVLVRTGNIDEAEKTLKIKEISPDYTSMDLYQAVQWIIPLFDAPIHSK